MAQDLKVAKAFQATISKEDKTPKSFTNQAGMKLFVWKVQFEGRTDWLSVNKQEGNTIKTGDLLYGDIVEGQWPDGNPKVDFVGAQRPMDAPAPQARPQPVQQSTMQRPQSEASTELEAKVDFLISLVENFLESQNSTKTAAAPTDTQSDDEPANLEELPY